MSSQTISDCSRILSNFGFSHDTLDEHEIAVAQYVSTTRLDTYLAVALVPSPCLSPPIFPLSGPSRTRATSIIATATTAFTFTMRAAHDRLDDLTATNSYTGAGKER